MKPEGSVDGMLSTTPSTPVNQTTEPVSTETLEPEDTSIEKMQSEATTPTQSTDMGQVNTSQPVPESAPQKTEDHEKKGGKAAWVLAIILAGVLCLGGGFLIGKSMQEEPAATNDSELQAQITSLQQQLDDAKQTVGDAVAGGQETLDSLQAEKATLQQSIEDLEAQVADLQDQLDQALATSGQN